MKRKWLVIFAALVVLAVAIGVAIRSRGPDVTLEYLGTNQLGTPLFVVKNHSGRIHYFLGLNMESRSSPLRSFRVAVTGGPAGPLAPHSFVQFPLNVTFNPDVDDLFMTCVPEAGFTTTVRHWARGAGLHWPAALSRLKPAESGPKVVPARISKPTSAINQSSAANNSR